MYGADLSEEAKQRLKQYGGTPINEIGELMNQCNIVIATTGVQGLIKKEWVQQGQMILALSNPNPEITPTDALEAGAAYAADGRSVNNVLGFPGIFRGVLNAQANEITHPLLVAAAEAIASCTNLGDLVPYPLDRNVHEQVAEAVERVNLNNIKVNA